MIEPQPASSVCQPEYVPTNPFTESHVLISAKDLFQASSMESTDLLAGGVTQLPWLTAIEQHFYNSNSIEG